jgi:hypothetical protein
MQFNHSFTATLVLLLLSVALDAHSQTHRPSSNFARVQMPEGVSLEVPKNWVVLGGSSRVLVDTWLEAKGITQVDSKAGFIAEAYDEDNRRLAALHVRYFPGGSLTQADLRKLSRTDLIRLDQVTREEAERAYRSMGAQFLSWEKSTIQQLNGLVAVIYGLRRNPALAVEDGIFRVRVVRIYAGARTFSVTVSYREQAAPLLEPVTDYIIRSIRQN